MIPLVFAFVMLALMWVIVIAPQMRRVKAHNEVVASLTAGMRVVTTSGLCGTIVDLDEEFLQLEIAPGVVVQFDRRAVGGPLDPPSGDDALPSAPSPSLSVPARSEDPVPDADPTPAPSGADPASERP